MLSEKEQFVTGLTGTTFSEVAIVISILPVLLLCCYVFLQVVLVVMFVIPAFPENME